MIFRIRYFIAVELFSSTDPKHLCSWVTKLSLDQKQNFKERHEMLKSCAVWTVDSSQNYTMVSATKHEADAAGQSF